MRKSEVVLEIAEVYDPEGQSVSKSVKLSLAGESRNLLNLRIHDITSSVRVFEFLLEKLKEENFFDGEMAEEKIKSVEKAYQTLKEESEFLKQVLRPPVIPL